MTLLDERPATGVVVDREPRCWRCARVLAHYAARPWAIDCKRCRATNQREQDERAIDKAPSSAP